MVNQITVLMAVYNGMPYLAEQIASLQAQSDRHFRVLLQDDGSTDGSLAFLEQVARQDPRFSLSPLSGRHLGASANFLSLMSQAEGYVALCDQDDVWSRDRLLFCRQAMEEEEKRVGKDTPVLVHSDLSVVDQSGAELHPSFIAHQGWNPKETRLSQLLVLNCATGCTMLFNEPLRRLVADHVREKDIIMHDWLITQAAAAFGQIHYIDLPLVSYRQHGHNTIGASQSGPIGRLMKALASPKKARDRVDLTFREAAVLRNSFGQLLPEDAHACVEAYLSIRDLPKTKRYGALKKGNHLMPRLFPRLGQIFLT
ncbi:MAG: glycosyltransferase family 2 protein [Clostridia bacterium]|nr:glycosyltransferase family 2 protein [Clostridia bacterium]